MVEDLLTDSLEDKIKELQDKLNSETRPLMRWHYYISLKKIRRVYGKRNDIKGSKLSSRKMGK